MIRYKNIQFYLDVKVILSLFCLKINCNCHLYISNILQKEYENSCVKKMKVFWINMGKFIVRQILPLNSTIKRTHLF